MSLALRIFFGLMLLNDLSGQQPRTYHIGNSLTGNSLPGSLPGVDAGTHLSCGNCLVDIVTDPENTCSELSHDKWPDALAQGGYDHIVIQPYPKGTVSAKEELNAWRLLADAGRAGSPQCKLWVYVPWPSQLKSWEDDFTDPEQPVILCRDFALWAFAELSADYENIGLIPAGEFVNNATENYYFDNLHLNEAGKHRINQVVYAYLFGLTGNEFTGVKELLTFGVPNGVTVHLPFISIDSVIGVKYSFEASADLTVWYPLFSYVGDGTRKTFKLDLSFPVYVRLKTRDFR